MVSMLETALMTLVSNRLLAHVNHVFSVEVRSAYGAEDIAKMKMYQLEQRDEGMEGQMVRKGSYNDPRVVSVIDYQEYRKLEDKRDRIMLKKTLYERKKVIDEQ